MTVNDQVGSPPRLLPMLAGGNGIPTDPDAHQLETGTLRQPSIKGLRTDVIATEVTWDDEIAPCFPDGP